MQQTGTGLLGAMMAGLLLSTAVNAADGTATHAAQSATGQSSTALVPSDNDQEQAPAGTADNRQTQTPAGQNNSDAGKTSPAKDKADAPAKPAQTEGGGSQPKPAQTEGGGTQPKPAQSPVKSSQTDGNSTSAQPAQAEGKGAPAKPAQSAGGKEKGTAKTAVKNTKAPLPKTSKVAACPDLNAPQVAELIKQDYTQNRFQRSDEDKTALGGANIITSINPEEITGIGDVWQAILHIRGQTADRNYGVTLDCQKGEITYSLNQ
ncbi:YebF family protein [Biostraticola tofi]|uniref:YebF-like protein n=1 Tax=Biostraticola tofi TaxID=466109 RepID=A0A4R3Z408_9GAMM|nr:YebF family protein [Biostraticola tofi]TCW00018.1 YebF-like protein [Biostraticola tofi]